MRLENPSHEAFFLEYMKNGFNATRAYMSVYPDTKEPSARASASELLTNLNITKRITEIQDELAENYGIDMQKLVDELNEIIALGKSGTVVDTEKGVRLLGQDLPASLKGIDMLIKIIGGQSVEKKEIINPQYFGFKKVGLDDLIGKEPSYNAEKLINLLQGEKSAYRNIVLLNSAFALRLAQKVTKVEEGVEQAKHLIDSGKAEAVLRSLQVS